MSDASVDNTKGQPGAMKFKSVLETRVDLQVEKAFSSSGVHLTGVRSFFFDSLHCPVRSACESEADGMNFRK